MIFSEKAYVGLGSRKGHPLTLNELDKALDEFWEAIKKDTRLLEKARLAGIDELAIASIQADVIVPRQDGGFDPVVTPIIVTFATKVAYDLWK